MLTVEQFSPTKPVLSLRLHLRVLIAKSCSVHLDSNRLLKVLQKDINNGSAHGLRDLLRTKVVTTRSSLEPILQQAQTDADNLLVVLIHQLTKE